MTYGCPSEHINKIEAIMAGFGFCTPETIIDATPNSVIVTSQFGHWVTCGTAGTHPPNLVGSRGLNAFLGHYETTDVHSYKQHNPGQAPFSLGKQLRVYVRLIWKSVSFLNHGQGPRHNLTDTSAQLHLSFEFEDGAKSSIDLLTLPSACWHVLPSGAPTDAAIKIMAWLVPIPIEANARIVYVTDQNSNVPLMRDETFIANLDLVVVAD